MKKYKAGNCLRGGFEGEFSSIKKAWSYLSKRFLISYPTDEPGGRRHIYMQVKEVNKYGFNQWLTCKEEETELNDLDGQEVLNKCKRTLIML